MHSNSREVVKFENVTVSYVKESPVLVDVNLSIFEGERIFVIGPNGGGKTTLLKTIIGAVKPEKGVVRLFGEPLEKFRDWWKIGYLPQQIVSLFEKMPVNVEELLLSGRVSQKSMEPSDVLEVAGVENIEKILRKKVTDLSAGNLQKVMLALALINRPNLLLLDEPTVYVDQTGINAFMMIIDKLHREWNLTTVIATHDVATISTFASRVICINRAALYDGDLVKLTASEELCNIYGFHVYTLRHRHRWDSK